MPNPACTPIAGLDVHRLPAFADNYLWLLQSGTRALVEPLAQRYTDSAQFPADFLDVVAHTAAPDADDRLAARFAAIYDKAYVQWTTGSDLLGHPLTKFDDLLTSLRWWAEKRTAW